jgi:ABC-type multidrug transport system fused ATPase/permease subunit
MSDPAVVVRATTRQSFTVGATSDAASYAAAASASGVISGSNTQSNSIDDNTGTVRVDMNRVHEARQAQEERRKSSSSNSNDHYRSRNDHGKQAGADDKPHHRHKHRVTRESPSDSFSGKYAVDVSGVSHSYDGKKDVLHKLDLQIETGQIYGLLGPSGCGKTTLIKALLAQLDPKEGDIKIFGEKPGSVNSQVPGHDVGQWRGTRLQTLHENLCRVALLTPSYPPVCLPAARCLRLVALRLHAPRNRTVRRVHRTAEPSFLRQDAPHG